MHLRLETAFNNMARFWIASFKEIWLLYSLVVYEEIFKWTQYFTSEALAINVIFSTCLAYSDKMTKNRIMDGSLMCNFAVKRSRCKLLLESKKFILSSLNSSEKFNWSKKLFSWNSQLSLRWRTSSINVSQTNSCNFCLFERSLSNLSQKIHT